MKSIVFLTALLSLITLINSPNYANTNADSSNNNNDSNEFNYADNLVERKIELPMYTKEDLAGKPGYSIDDTAKAGSFEYFSFTNVGKANLLTEQFHQLAQQQNLNYRFDAESSMTGYAYRSYKGNFYSTTGEFDFTVDLDWTLIFNLPYCITSSFQDDGTIVKIPLLVIDDTPIFTVEITSSNGNATYSYRASSFELFGKYTVAQNGMGVQASYVPRIKLKWQNKIERITILNRDYTSSVDNPSSNYDPSELRIGFFKAKENEMYQFPFDILSYNATRGEMKLGNFSIKPYAFEKLTLRVPVFDDENNIVAKKSATYTASDVTMNIVDGNGKPATTADDNFIVVLSGFPLKYYASCRIELINISFKYYNGHIETWNFDRAEIKDRYSFGYYYDAASGFFTVDVIERFFEDNNAGIVQINAGSYIPLIGLIYQGVDAYQNINEWNEQYFIFNFYDELLNKIDNITMIKMKYQKGYWHANYNNYDRDGRPSTYPNDSNNPQKNVKVENLTLQSFSYNELFYTDDWGNKIRKPGLRYFDEMKMSLGDEFSYLNDNLAALFTATFAQKNSYESDKLYYAKDVYYYYNNFRDGNVDDRISYMAPLEIWFHNEELGYTQRLVGNYAGLHVAHDEYGNELVLDLDGNIRDDYGVGHDEDTGSSFVGKDENGDGEISSDECIDPDTATFDTSKGDDLDNSAAQENDFNNFVESLKEHWDSFTGWLGNTFFDGVKGVGTLAGIIISVIVIVILVKALKNNNNGKKKK